MKKWSYGLCLTLILAVCASVGFASAQTERVGPRRLAVVNHADPDTLACIWARPQEDATPFFRYYNGVELVVFEEFENGWASVAIGPIEGYMKTESLTIGAEAEQGRSLPIYKVVNPAGTIWTNFRDKPKMESTVIDQYPTGKEVTLLGVSDEWYQVFTNSTMGFIKSEFLEDTGKTGGYIMGGPAPYPTPAVPDKPTTSIAAIEPVYFHPIPTPQMTETAVTRSQQPGERVPMYFEPSNNARLLGEYFDGVSVNILEYVSDEWVFIDICTYGTAGGYGYMMAKDLAFGAEAEQVAKTTIMYESTGYFILNTQAMGQSGDIGPFYAGTQVELLGLAVSERSGLERPLPIEGSALHVRIGEVIGFLQSYDENGLQKVSP